MMAELAGIKPWAWARLPGLGTLDYETLQWSSSEWCPTITSERRPSREYKRRGAP
jgi:hypothetical protein